MRGNNKLHEDRFARASRRVLSPLHANLHEYEPETLPWPELDEEALGRAARGAVLGGGLYTERRAGAIVTAFTETITDPVVKDAVELQGCEEARHAELIRVMIDEYNLDAPKRPMEDITDHIETAFKDFGYGECVDSFLGFGVFKMARNRGSCPGRCSQIFEMLMYEETRHIVFFINWMAYTQRQAARSGCTAARCRSPAALRSSRARSAG